MKKLFISVALLATFASCSKNEEVSAPQGDAVGFATLNNRVSKAANLNDNGKSNSYQVFATTSVNGESSWFIDETVGTDDAIISQKTYYWPAAATVNFYAFAPAGGANSPVSYKEIPPVYKSTIPLRFIVEDTADDDFTVATPVLGATSSSATQGTVTDGKVTLTFNHMLTKASMAITLDAELLKTSKFSFEKAEFSVAKNAVTTDAYLAAGAKPTSVSEGDAATYAYNFTTDDNTTANTTFSADNELFFAPQAAGAGCSIKLSGVSIITGTTEIFKGNLTYKIDDALAFEQGKAYAFTITITADAAKLPIITFEAADAGWDTTTNVGLTVSEESKPAPVPGA